MSAKYNETHDFTTRSVHAGRYEDSSAVPIFQSINAPIEDRVGYVSAVGAVGGPTVEAMETLVSDLEGADWSVAAPSGMAAISLVLFGLLQAGDRVVAHRCIYQYAERLLNEDLTEKWGITVEWIDMHDLAQLETALQTPAKLVYFDPVSNPAM
ncbi:MAG: PLP-dependent transferase, partial [Anaerolineae bacterium]